MTWHVLDVGSIWIKEFASALGSFESTVGWAPAMRTVGLFERWEREEQLKDPPLRIRHFPLQRGYARFPLSTLTNLSKLQTERMLRHNRDRASGSGAPSPLICTTPFYAGVAERWKGPVVYYQTDLTIAYEDADARAIRSCDRRLCQAAAVVCTNSRRIGEYMVHEAGCDPAKIAIVPNATRATNILAHAPSKPAELPEDLRELRRPVVGVLGNLAANLDWRLLMEAVEQTPDFSWAFVGPTEMNIADAPQKEARERLLRYGGRVRFTGSKPYAALQEYARAFDAAVLPYVRKEPTFSGSSTRYYEHLAACRPIISTRGFEELLHKEPLLALVDSGGELAGKLAALKRANFEDGMSELRWEASRRGTWHVRAATLARALAARWDGELPLGDMPGGEEDTFQIATDSRFALIS
jgi:glycosyltransferase involved in cell wall biosynthesis